MSSDTGYYSIIDYVVDGPRTQHELIDAFAELQERWVRFYPGYRSARIFASLDGTRVYNVVHWASEADYRHFEATSDTAGRVAAIEAAVASVSGRAEPRMTGPPRFTMAREVGPGPRRTDPADPASGRAPDTRAGDEGGRAVPVVRHRGALMPSGDHLPEADLARYHAEGYLHVPGVLDQDEVEALLADALAVLDRRATLVWGEGESDALVMDWVADPELASEAMRHLALHPRVVARAEQLAGRPLRLFKTELLRKHGGASLATPAHLDAPAFPFRAAPVNLTAWVALTDVPVERGCMTFLPGSHHETGDVADFDPMSARPELAWWPRVTVPVRAGDVTFHHERTVHLAGANVTDEHRISLATVYMDAAATFDRKGMGDAFASGDISGLGPDVLARLAPGEPLDGDRFPLARAGAPGGAP